MATNIVYELGDHLAVVASDPASPNSGDVVRWGTHVGMAVTKKNTTDNLTTVNFHCVGLVSARGVDGSGNNAIAAGDDLYYVDADTPKLSKKTSGTKAGTAMDAVASGATATIRVRFVN